MASDGKAPLDAPADEFKSSPLIERSRSSQYEQLNDNPPQWYICDEYIFGGPNAQFHYNGRTLRIMSGQVTSDGHFIGTVPANELTKITVRNSELFINDKPFNI